MTLSEKKISINWLFLFGTIFLTLVTFYMLRIYSLAHWEITNYSVKINLMSESAILKTKLYKIDTDSASNPQQYMNKKELTELNRNSDKLRKNSHFLLQLVGIYHFTGILSFIFMLCSFAFKPRKIGLIGLPFGVLSIGMAIIVM